MFKKYDAYKDSGVEWLGDIPQQWELKKLKFVLNEINIRSETGNETLLSLSKYKGIIPKDSLEERSGGASTLIGYKKVFKDNLVINKMQAVNGLLAVSQLDGITSPDYSIYCAKNNLINIYYISFLLNQPEYLAEMKKRVTGVMEGFIRLYTDDLYDIKVQLPSITEQNLIVDFLQQKIAEIDQAIAIKEQQIALLNERKQIVIQKAVTQGLDPNVSMKDSGIDGLGYIPKNWAVKKLKEICNTYGRIGFRGYGVKDIVGEKEGAITLSPSNINEEGMIFDKLSYLSWAKYYESPEIMININDILIVKTGSSFGKVGYVDTLPEKSTINPQLLKISNILINSKYLYYVLVSEYIQLLIRKNVIGSTIPTISEDKILNMKVCIPDMLEQQQIVNYIEEKTIEISDLVGVIKLQILKLKEYKTTLINDAVTGKIKVA